MNLTAALIFRFIDRLSGPARAAARAVGDIERAQKMASRASDQWSRGLSDLDGKLDRLANVSLVTEGLNRAGQAMARPLIGAARASISYSESLATIGDTADMTTEGIGRLDRAIRAASRAGGRGPAEIAAAAGIFAAAGMSEEVTSRLLGTTTKVAVGTKTNFDVAARAAVSFSQNLGVAADQMERAFDAAHFAAKQGKFELSDMAQYLPSLGAIGARRGMQGVSGVAELTAALKVIRDQTGESSEAANYARDLLMKLDANETVSNFDKFGIDLRAALAEQRARGATALDAVMNVTSAAMGKGAQLNQLFTDQQAQLGLAALMDGRQEFERVRAEAERATGTVQSSFNRISNTDAERMRRYTASMERVAIAAGSILAPAAGAAAVALESITGWMSAAVESGNPLAKVAIWAAAGFAAVAVSAGVVGNAVMGILGPFYILKSLMGDVGQGAMAGAWAKIATGLGRARAAALAFNLTMLANPVVLGIAAAVAAIAVVALVVRKYWQPIKAFMTGVGQGVAEAFAPLAAVLAPLRPVWDAIASGIGKAWTWITRILEPVRSTQEELAGATSAGRSFGRILGAALKIPLLPLMALGYVGARVFGFIRRLFNWSPAATLSRLWTPIGGFFGRLWSGARAVVSQGLAAIVALVMRFTVLGPIIRNWSAITGFLGRVWTLASEIVGLGVDSIRLALLRFTPLGMIVRNWGAITGFFGHVWSSVASATSSGVGAVGGFIQRWNPIAIVSRNWTPITGVVGRVWSLVSGVVGRGVARVGSLILSASPLGIIVRNWTPITGFIGGVWTTIRGLVATGLRAIGTALSSWSPLSALQTAFAGAFSWLQGLPARFTTMGSNIVDGMIAGIRGRRAAVQGAAAAAAGGTATAAAGALGIRSPSRVFARLGDFTMQGLAQGLGRSAAGPMARVAALAAALSTTWPAEGLATTVAIEAVRSPVPAARQMDAAPAATPSQADASIPAPSGDSPTPAPQVARAPRPPAAASPLGSVAEIIRRMVPTPSVNLAAPASPFPMSLIAELVGRFAAPRQVPPASRPLALPLPAPMPVPAQPLAVPAAPVAGLASPAAPPPVFSPLVTVAAPSSAEPDARPPATPQPAVSPMGWLAELASRIVLLSPAAQPDAAPIAASGIGSGFVASLTQTLDRLARPETTASGQAAPIDPEGARPAAQLIGTPAAQPQAPAPSSQAAAAPVQQVHHHYGDQHFTVSGEGKGIRELARELDRLRRTAGRAGMHDGGE